MRAKEIFGASIISILFLIIFNILMTASLPTIGLSSFKISFNLLLILYLCFRKNMAATAILIFVIQYVNSYFTLEHWSIGTVAGIFTLWLMNNLRELIHLSSFALTSAMTFAFSFFWFVITSILIYIQVSDFSVIIHRLWRFIPEAIFLALIAPVVFSFLDRIWQGDYSSSIEAS